MLGKLQDYVLPDVNPVSMLVNQSSPPTVITIINNYFEWTRICARRESIVTKRIMKNCRNKCDSEVQQPHAFRQNQAVTSSLPRTSPPREDHALQDMLVPGS